MSSLSNIWIKKETLETLLKTVTAKNEKGVSIDISIGEDTNEYGQNLTAYVSQTKEQRESGVSKFYVGNGKNFWNDGKITVAEKKTQSNGSQGNSGQENDLPF